MTASCALSKILFLTKDMHGAPAGGRELLSRLNHDALADLYGDRLVVFELSGSRLKGLVPAFNAFHGHIDGLGKRSLSDVLRVIETQQVRTVFVDGSNLGAAVAAIRKRFPAIEVCSFFHNVEARFFLGAFRQKPALRSLSVLVANYIAERKAVLFSDKRICLSERDSRMLQRVYGRTATHVSPMALVDKLPHNQELEGSSADSKFALFVGGLFYANRAGIAWFIDHVVPRIGIKLCIAGSGFERFKHDLERQGQVDVVGSVESLAPWYRDAAFVIAPIFDGSGMKTKVAEALMFGKLVIGTPEAFSGYEAVAEQAGVVCATADEFVQAIQAASSIPAPRFDPHLRALYEQHYSYPAARSRLAAILGTHR